MKVNRDAALKVLENNLGSETARLYKTFYEKKTDEEIYRSIKQLLTEVNGPGMAEQQVKEIVSE